MKYYANKIMYNIIEEKDGWFTIYEWDSKIPIIQADTLQHAKDYCYLREPVTAPMQKLC